VGSGFLKQHRASAQRVIRLCLEEQAKRMDSDSAAASNVGLWWYHQASSASHLLPDGLNSFVTVLNPMNAETGFGISRSQIADAVDAAFHCLVGGHEVEAAYWGWPLSIDVLKEASATFNSLHRMRS
jgi:hypothetical protein